MPAHTRPPHVPSLGQSAKSSGHMPGATTLRESTGWGHSGRSQREPGGGGGPCTHLLVDLLHLRIDGLPAATAACCSHGALGPCGDEIPVAGGELIVRPLYAPRLLACEAAQASWQVTLSATETAYEW